MTKTDKAQLRVEVQTLIHQHRDEIGPNLDRFFQRWAEDLIEAGMPEEAVANSLMVVTLSAKAAVAGPAATAALLRAAAAGYDDLASGAVKRH